LTGPIGTRSLAMGSTGLVISIDGTAMFHNPSILGIKNSRWNGGEVQFYDEDRGGHLRLK